jgi:hypothetical protein
MGRTGCNKKHRWLSLTAVLELGKNRHNNLVDRGTKMIQPHEDQETASNFVNSEEIDFLWPNWTWRQEMTVFLC